MNPSSSATQLLQCQQLCICCSPSCCLLLVGWSDRVNEKNAGRSLNSWYTMPLWCVWMCAAPAHLRLALLHGAWLMAHAGCVCVDVLEQIVHHLGALLGLHAARAPSTGARQ